MQRLIREFHVNFVSNVKYRMEREEWSVNPLKGMISLSRLAANTQVGRNDKEKLRRDLAKPETSGLSLLRRGRRLGYR